MNMLRRLLISLMVLTLAVTSVSCGGAPAGGDSSRIPNVQQTSMQASQNKLADGQYPVQQATYDDATGEYTVMLLNTKPGDSSVYRTANLPMARLTDEEISQGQKSYLKTENGQASLHLTEDFKIEYVHNVTENVTNPQTGQTETVIVRQESSFWTPFAGALAGQALGSLLFRPQYYFPPVYQPGVVLTGYGGYGRTYNDAVSNYRTRYNTAPAEVRNRQNFRTTGRLRTPTGQTRVGTNRSSDRSTGTGYGSNTLRRSNSNRSYNTNRSRGFGSSRSRSFSGGRRR
ncbi:hypothetical protein OsccyDRAFT_2363 [Leptolyngbyaceae cyanobacterium JSC-12]|nr:hypothetical protein OsccyDRAFT_2363 [Leptolyngbyaceae cyanobacterium JSC-12]